MIRPSGAIPLALAGLVLPGCTLIDQNTFNPAVSAVPVVARAPAVPPASTAVPPLLTLRPGEAAQGVVRQAVAAARSRKADVVFDVVAMVPESADDDQVTRASVEAGTVARLVRAQGVTPDRVRLLARPEAGLAGREVRVYVR